MWVVKDPAESVRGAHKQCELHAHIEQKKQKYVVGTSSLFAA